MSAQCDSLSSDRRFYTQDSSVANHAFVSAGAHVARQYPHLSGNPKKRYAFLCDKPTHRTYRSQVWQGRT